MIMNIEKTISEHAVSDILTPMLESQDRIVTEDIAPLFNKATGLDTPPASGTVTTTIEESRSVITAIIRKAWTATLTMLGGASVLSYIAAAYTYLRNRLQGNETYGIPDRRSEISASSPLAANLALLNDRKISGVPEAVDGMSLVQLIGSDYAAVTKLEDNTKGWTCRENLIDTLLGIFTNLNEVTLGLSAITARISANTSRTLKITLTDCSQLRDDSNIGSFNEGCPNFDVHIYGLKTTNFTGNNRQPLNVGRYSLYDYEKGVFRNGGNGQWTNYATTYIYLGCKGAKTDLIRFWNNDANATTTDIEIRDGACQSLTFQNFTGLTAENMYNHILCRLKQDEPNCGSGVTITLGSTNIAKLEAVEEYNTKLTELEDTYGYTFA